MRLIKMAGFCWWACTSANSAKRYGQISGTAVRCRRVVRAKPLPSADNDLTRWWRNAATFEAHSSSQPGARNYRVRMRRGFRYDRRRHCAVGIVGSVRTTLVRSLVSLTERWARRTPLHSGPEICPVTL